MCNVTLLVLPLLNGRGGGGSDLLGLEVTYSEAVDPFEEDLGIRQ